jgi:uncharacterized membrane protein
MRSNVEIAGHPLHPIIVAIAIGAFVCAFIFDIAALATAAGSWFVMSFWTLLIGVCAGALSALTGLYDYLTLRMSHAARRDATIHLCLNVSFMVLFIVSVILKGQFAAGGAFFVPYGRVATTFVLDILGIVILLASGWFGGEVVYRHGVAVTEQAAAEICPPAGATPAMGAAGGEARFDLPDPDEEPGDE